MSQTLVCQADNSLRAAGAGADGNSVDTIVFENVSLAAMVGKAGLDVDGQARAGTEVVATEDRVRRFVDCDRGIAAAAG